MAAAAPRKSASAAPRVNEGGDLRVTAPLVQVTLGKRAVQFYYGDVLPEGVSDESLKHLKSLGYVDEVDAPESDDN